MRAYVPVATAQLAQLLVANLRAIAASSAAAIIVSPSGASVNSTPSTMKGTPCARSHSRTESVETRHPVDSGGAVRRGRGSDGGEGRRDHDEDADRRGLARP